MEMGALRIINAKERVSNMTVPLTADLLNARLTDSVPPCLFLHLANINFNKIKQLAVNITVNGINEYKNASI